MKYLRIWVCMNLRTSAKQIPALCSTACRWWITFLPTVMCQGHYTAAAAQAVGLRDRASLRVPDPENIWASRKPGLLLHIAFGWVSWGNNYGPVFPLGSGRGCCGVPCLNPFPLLYSLTFFIPLLHCSIKYWSCKPLPWGSTRQWRNRHLLLPLSWSHSLVHTESYNVIYMQLVDHTNYPIKARATTLVSGILLPGIAW